MQPPRYFLSKLVVASIFILGLPSVPSRADDRPEAPYPAELRDKSCNFVVAKVVEIKTADFVRIRASVLTDMRGTIKAGTAVSIRGPAVGIMSSGSDAIDAEAGQVCVFLIKPLGDSGGFEYVHQDLYPFGIRPWRPAIPPDDVPRVFAALQQLNSELAAPVGGEMSRELARALLLEKNPYLWALGCWRLAYQAELKDLQRFQTMMVETDLTPIQAVFLDELFDHVTGDWVGSVPSINERRVLLRQVLERYVNATSAAHPASTRPGEP
jgi:hypothetical protein